MVVPMPDKMTRRFTVSIHVEEATFFNGRLTSTKGLPCSAKMVYKRVKWLNRGAEPRRVKCC